MIPERIIFVSRGITVDRDKLLTADCNVVYFYKQYLYEKLNPDSAKVKVPNTMPAAHHASTKFFALRFKNGVRFIPQKVEIREITTYKLIF